MNQYSIYSSSLPTSNYLLSSISSGLGSFGSFDSFSNRSFQIRDNLFKSFNSQDTNTSHSNDSLMDSDVFSESLDLSLTEQHSDRTMTFAEVNEFTLLNNKTINYQQIQLWQFLLELLMDNRCENYIRWTNVNENEFVLIDPNQIAKLWGICKNKPSMNNDKLNRGLRYYYNKKILQKTIGKRNTYYFQIDIKPYLQQTNVTM